MDSLVNHYLQLFNPFVGEKKGMKEKFHLNGVVRGAHSYRKHTLLQPQPEQRGPREGILQSGCMGGDPAILPNWTPQPKPLGLIKAIFLLLTATHWDPFELKHLSEYVPRLPSVTVHRTVSFCRIEAILSWCLLI